MPNIILPDGTKARFIKQTTPLKIAQKISQELADKGIVSKATSPKSLAEEAPGAYKDVESVIDSVHNSGISLKVVRMKPIGVLKG